MAAPEEKRQETFLSCPLRTVGGTLPKHTIPAIPFAHEVVPALRIARQRPTDPQILHVFVRVESPVPGLLISVSPLSWQVCTAALSFSDCMTWRMPKKRA